VSEPVFDHVGSFRCAGRLVICDVERLAPPAMQRDLELEVLPGGWQAFIVRELGKSAIHFVVLAHDDELDRLGELDQAKAWMLLRIDSGRIAVLTPELCADDRVRTTVLVTERDDLPAMVRAPDAGPDEEPGGAVVDVDTAGTFAIYRTPLGPDAPASAVFIALAD
jgi:hypothetical protein